MSQGGYDDDIIYPGQGPGMTRSAYDAWGRDAARFSGENQHYSCWHCGTTLSLETHDKQTPEPDPDFYEPPPPFGARVFVCPTCHISWQAVPSAGGYYPAFGVDGYEWRGVYRPIEGRPLSPTRTHGIERTIPLIP